MHIIFTEKVELEFMDLFDDQLGMLPGTVHLTVDENVKPEVCPKRKVPTAINQPVKNKLDRMMENKVIRFVKE